MPKMAQEKRLTNKRSQTGSYKLACMATNNVLPFECENCCGKFGIFCHIRHNNYQHKFKDQDSNSKHSLAMNPYLAFFPNQNEVPESIEYTELISDMENNSTTPETTLISIQVEEVEVTNKHGCELCDFLPQSTNKYSEKTDHQIRDHFKAKMDNIIPKGRPFKCPDCKYVGRDNYAVVRHYVKHGILKKWVNEALKPTGIWYTSHYTGNPQNEQKSVSNEPQMILCSKCGKGFSDEQDLRVHMYVHP